MRTIDISRSIFQPLEETIYHKFIPVLTGQVLCPPDVRKHLSIPTHHGGLNTVEIVEIQQFSFKSNHLTCEEDDKCTIRAVHYASVTDSQICSPLNKISSCCG